MSKLLFFMWEKDETEAYESNIVYNPDALDVYHSYEEAKQRKNYHHYRWYYEL